MLNIRVQKMILITATLGAVGCSHPNKMKIDTAPQRAHRAEPIVAAPIKKRPAIQEEILIHQNGIRNPNLGTISSGTTKHPTSRESQTDTSEVNTTVEVPVNQPILVENNSSLSTNETIQTTEEPMVSREIHERMPFPEEEYRHIRKRGSSTVKGKVYLENSATSEEIVKSKVKLWLNPVTSYSRQWYEESYLNGYKLGKTDRRLYNYLKFTYSNSAGHFDFFGVPRGQYYLTATIHCATECGFANEKSVLVVREISVGRGTTSVDLTKSVP